MNADDIQERTNRDKGHWLTGADVSGCHELCWHWPVIRSRQSDTVRYSGVLNTVKSTFALVDGPLRTDCCSHAAVTLLQTYGTTLRKTHYTFLRKVNCHLHIFIMSYTVIACEMPLFGALFCCLSTGVLISP
jgi:hypothetical protein